MIVRPNYCIIAYIKLVFIMCKTQSILLKKLGQNINLLRLQQGLTFKELALKSKIDKSNLVKITTKGSNITQESSRQLAKALNVPISKLYSFCNDKNCVFETTLPRTTCS